MTLYPGVAFVTGAGSEWYRSFTRQASYTGIYGDALTHVILSNNALGIGRQTAISFAAEGCTKITIADTTNAGLLSTQQAIEAIAPEAHVLVASMDVRVEQDVVQAVADTVQRFGRIDYAVNCAGIYGPGAASPDVAPSDFDDVFAVNARGVWLCAREQTRQMKTQEPLPSHDGRPGSRGAIVNVASSLGISPIPGKTPYAASKAAVIQMTKSDALDCSPSNIRVNAVAPGITDTPFTAEIPDDGEAVRAMPVPRKSTPQEIADVILFAASSKASFLQGAIISADGGHTI
ncbi:oxidoreductase, short-chain dehydrogenase/reductase family [Cordyceps militaris CM01]|uniref:Oxidoreductase, short-chain dehydrogenase/reductase family n=1 Tax=Cordyceps militaris (strain CM01) TaxID=983644 RepID=G3J8V7_CORMM|nr:oxidoreductase, short-chain dehydrogenase/reductase family [Cordyceps militaris CM01]EGX94840.1 oxidoreductase, short-chain dehydrogenase/reductase family [Cordyceps militaris CM01]